MKGWPGLGDFTAGGSALAGESSQEAVGRKLLEELGVDISFAGIRPALSLPFGKGFDDIFTREQELELAALRLQPEEVEAVQWAGEAKVLAMLEEGTFVPYHPGLVMLLFSLRNTRSSHTRPDSTRRNRRDPEDGTEGISRFSSGKSLPFGKEYATIHLVLSRNDGIGRRGGLKIRWANTPCGFESHFRHQTNIIRTRFRLEMDSDLLFSLSVLRIRISVMASLNVPNQSREARANRNGGVRDGIVGNIRLCLCTL